MYGGDRFDIIAAQEMGINGFTKTPYCPRSGPYHMVWEPGSRAAIFVSKQIPEARWSSQTGRDWASVTLVRDNCRVTFYSVYIQQQHRGTPWVTPLHHLVKESPPEGTEVVLMGDMNLHSPLWDRHERRTPGVEALLYLAERWDLELLTPKGETTRLQRGNRQERDSTIDHIWASPGARATYIGPMDLPGSDHLPQVAEISHKPLPEVDPELQRYDWKKMDASLLALIIRRYRQPPTITTEGQCRAEWNRLTTFLQRAAADTTPRLKRSRGRRAAWWTREVQEAVRAARRAERRWRAHRSHLHHNELEAATREKVRVVALAKAQAWRNVVAEASTKQKLLWSLERWARTRSHTTPDPVKIPALTTEEGTKASTHEEKAEVLAARFFPAVTAESQRNDHTPGPQRDPGSREGIEVAEEDVKEVLLKMGNDKAPGEDLIGVRFLKACGKPVRVALARLIQGSFETGYFPQQFRRGIAVTLRKPGKKVAEMDQAGSWRPITLLSSLGKVVEAILSRRITNFAERTGVLPEGQMGNRTARNTELAVRVVTDLVAEAWRLRGIASLLQLDLTGAFDRVHHGVLIETLRGYGFPEWISRLVQSFLEDRTTRLQFDGQLSRPFPIAAGVPQGSPVSPVLFLIYIATLYTRLHSIPGVAVVGFADDTNLLACGKGPAQTCQSLEAAWDICEGWARERGMVFNAGKSELLHFTRAHRPLTQPIVLSGRPLFPKESARFLGVWLDRKLKWTAHIAQVKAKMSTQKYALTRIAAKTWGCSYDRARQIYTACIRSALVYGASAWHKLTQPGGCPRGPAKQLLSIQTDCLRTVAGAYKRTAIRDLEAETEIPPLDLYLNERVAAFEGRLRSSPAASLIEEEKSKLPHLLEAVRRRRRRKPLRGRDEGLSPRLREVLHWQGTERIPADATLRDWKVRWEGSFQARGGHLGRAVQAADFPTFDAAPRKLRRGLTKAEASLLTQMRTGKIGLRGFLFQAKAVGINTPYCECGGRETVHHLAVYCPHARPPLLGLLPDIRTGRDLRGALNDPQRARKVIQWMLSLGRLREYSLYQKIEGLNEAQGVEIPRDVPKQRKARKSSEKGAAPPKWATDYWITKSVPGVQGLQVLLPESAWAPATASWSIVDSHYGPPPAGYRPQGGGG